jgi:hypothetical protein
VTPTNTPTNTQTSTPTPTGSETLTTSTTTVEPVGCIYYFSDAGSSTEIGDGGDDMYDGANSLYANNQQINYTHTQLLDDEDEQLYSNFTYDGVVFSGTSSSYFGPSSSYFTNLYPGLFVLAARGVNIGTFSIEGDIGADGSGEVDSYNFQTNHPSGVHQTFVKRVWDAGDPSINHIIIVNALTASTITQFVPTDTNDDTHILSGLQSQTVSNIYYLLSSKRDGVRITNTEITGMVSSFLNISASSSSISDLLTNLNTRFSEITSVLNSDCHEAITTTTTTQEPTTTTTSTTTTDPQGNLLNCYVYYQNATNTNKTLEKHSFFFYENWNVTATYSGYSYSTGQKPTGLTASNFFTINASGSSTFSYFTISLFTYSNDNFTIYATTEQSTKGLNSLDALRIARYFTGGLTFSETQKKIADVNATGTINSTDALRVQQRFVGLVSNFNKGDWGLYPLTFSLSELAATNSGYILTITMSCIGDVA